MKKCGTRKHILGNDQEHDTILVSDKIAKEDETKHKYIGRLIMKSWQIMEQMSRDVITVPILYPIVHLDMCKN